MEPLQVAGSGEAAGRERIGPCSQAPEAQSRALLPTRPPPPGRRGQETYLAPCCHCPFSRSLLRERPSRVGVSAPGSQFLNSASPLETPRLGVAHCRAGLRNLAAGTPIHRHCSPTAPQPQDRTGQVGRSQRPRSSLAVPACLWVPWGGGGTGWEHCKLKAPGKYSGSFQPGFGGHLWQALCLEGSASSRVLDHLGRRPSRGRKIRA